MRCTLAGNNKYMSRFESYHIHRVPMVTYNICTVGLERLHRSGPTHEAGNHRESLSRLRDYKQRRPWGLVRARHNHSCLAYASKASYIYAFQFAFLTHTQKVRRQ